MLGAAALGAVAVGALALGRLSVRHAKLRRVEIGDLAIGRLIIGGDARTAILRVRAQPGKGDAFQRLIATQVSTIARHATFLAHRSEIDPDVFLLQTSWSGPGRDAPKGRPLVFERLFRDAAEKRLIAASSEEPEAFHVFRSI
ncbi:hypothetical protein RGQ15_16460 [Paracoccus sp. MBLB3053]|uniref:Antibiotic biosynthesis monooxygenase n=1 Tax=Paracoccus aurantius TaxID=3073814 RepID=A0ABU2HXA4_9RHOB|nr:hypothetical protein [Paracoccus sp. MBLB3053]MDS9469155.1 hypothetical protein [Paracoccus sp. MBLB3053]